MKKLIVFALCIISLRSWGQIDEKRMQRDLEVAKNILNTLISDNNDMLMMGSDIDASYLPGYGVTFTLPDNPFFWHISMPHRAISIGQGRSYSYRYKMSSSDTPELPEHQDSNVAIVISPDKENYTVEDNGDSDGDAVKAKSEMDKKEEHLKQAIITFFSDYADLIAQLGPDSRIRVIQKMMPDFPMIAWSTGDGEEVQKGSSGFSAEVYKKDITAYKEGKIKLGEFKERVTFTDANKKNRSADLDIFSKIMKSYFSPDVSQTYFIQNNPAYERIEDYGVIYSVKTYSSYQSNDVFNLPTTGQQLNLQERNKKVEEMYPEFEKELKNFIVDYGRTIRSLGDNENLILKVSLTRCEGCSMPKSLEVTVKASVLSQYDQQKISRDKALAAINVKKFDQ